jgi:hypothetical protein
LVLGDSTVCSWEGCHTRNDNRRLRGHCAEGCPWNLYASKDNIVNSFVVKTYYGVHNCQKEWVLRKCTARWLVDKYIDSFRADEMSISSFGRTVQKDLNVSISRSKLARARRQIMDTIHGDEVQQYNSLRDYGEELRRSNPRSTFYLNTTLDNLFSTCYMSLDACKRGFLAGCRPIICLDRCHIKTKYGGQLLIAVGMDPNDCLYPIAMTVFEVESLNSWKWFLETLKEDLKIENTYPWTIMSDKQKVCMSSWLPYFLCIFYKSIYFSLTIFYVSVGFNLSCTKSISRV